MKKLLALILLFLPAYLNAQTTVLETGRLINRIDQQEGVMIKQVASQQAQDGSQSSPSFKITFPSTGAEIIPGATNSIIGTIEVIGNTPVTLNFHRTHLHLPSGWSTSVCFGASCYSTTTDSLPVGGYTFDPGTPGTFTLDLNCPKTSPADSVVDYINLTAEDGNPNDTISFTLIGVLTPDAGVQQEVKQPSSSPKITSIYPTPLIQGSAIKVKVSSPRESNLSYSIYDGVGRVVALGVTRQHIGLGDNTINIGALDGLSNGSYMLKFNFADGTSDTHFFQILH